MLLSVLEKKTVRLTKTFEVIQTQLEPIAQAINENPLNWKRVVIAYEPVWAIGTGLSATPEQAEEVHVYVRKLLSSKYGTSISNNIRIIYGGSVSVQNCDSLLSQNNIDGFLVGKASFEGQDFIQILGSPSRTKKLQL